MELQEALEELIRALGNGENIFLTGPPGSGKEGVMERLFSESDHRKDRCFMSGFLKNPGAAAGLYEMATKHRTPCVVAITAFSLEEGVKQFTQLVAAGRPEQTMVSTDCLTRIFHVMAHLSRGNTGIKVSMTRSERGAAPRSHQPSF